MALKNYVDKVGPVFAAAWGNIVDLLINTITADANHFVTFQPAPTSFVGNPQVNAGTRAVPFVQPSFMAIYLTDPGGTTGMAIHNVNASPGAVNFGIELGNNVLGDALAGGITSSTYNTSFFNNMPAGPVCFLAPVTNAYPMVLGAGAKAGIAVSIVGGNPVLQGGGNTNGVMCDMTPDNGVFVGTLTGMTTVVTGNFNWERIGRKVTIWNDGAGITGTSNTTGFSITGVPAIIAPFNNRGGAAYNTEDNTLTGILAAWSVIGNGGVGTTSIVLAKFNAGTGQWLSTAWTAAGVKGVNPGFTVSYVL